MNKCSYCGNEYSTQHRMTIHRTKCSIRKARLQVEMLVATQPHVTQQFAYTTNNTVIAINGVQVTDDHLNIFRQKFLDILINMGPRFMANGCAGLDELQMRIHDDIVSARNPIFTAIAEMLLRRVTVSENDLAKIVALEQELVNVWKDVIPTNHPDFQEMIECLETYTIIAVAE